MIRGFLNLPWFAWAVLSVLIAVVYSVVWPHPAAPVSGGFRFFVLRWGHALTWLLLAVNFTLRGVDAKFNGVANMMAAAAGLNYLLFMLLTFVLK